MSTFTNVFTVAVPVTDQDRAKATLEQLREIERARDESEEERPTESKIPSAQDLMQGLASERAAARVSAVPPLSERPKRAVKGRKRD